MCGYDVAFDGMAIVVGFGYGCAKFGEGYCGTDGGSCGIGIDFRSRRIRHGNKDVFSHGNGNDNNDGSGNGDDDDGDGSWNCMWRCGCHELTERAG